MQLKQESSSQNMHENVEYISVFELISLSVYYYIPNSVDDDWRYMKPQPNLRTL